MNKPDWKNLSDKELQELIARAQGELDGRDRYRFVLITHYLSDDTPVSLSLRYDRIEKVWTVMQCCVDGQTIVESDDDPTTSSAR